VSPEGVIIALVLFAGALVWVIAPLIRGARGEGDALAQKRRERLLVYYERVLTNLRDLDEDFATGKIAEPEYHDERETWVQRGIQVLRAMDALEAEGQPPAAADDEAIDREIDSAIEAAVAAYRNK
jgi:hypothetical protein